LTSKDAKISKSDPTSKNAKSLGTTKPSTPCKTVWGQISLMLFTGESQNLKKDVNLRHEKIRRQKFNSLKVHFSSKKQNHP